MQMFWLSATLCMVYGYSRLSSVGIRNVGIGVRSMNYHDHIINPIHNAASGNTSFSLNVLDFGAVGDAKTDNTEAFNKALQAAVSNDKGGYVIVPSGQYLFSGTITIPEGVTLIGSYLVVPFHSAPSGDLSGISWNDLKDGSILGYDGKSSDVFIKMSKSSSIKGFSVYYPKQVCNNAQPLTYAASISVEGPNVAVLDIELINSYIGITMVNGETARHYIARIEGGPIYQGIVIDNCHDIGRIENIHFKSAWACSLSSYNSNNIKNTIMHWTGLYGVSFVIGDTDWEYMFNTFSWAYAIGYHFVETSSGSPNGNFLGIASDANSNASIMVDSTKAWGIAITNGEFVARANTKVGIDYSSNVTSLVVSKTNIGNVHLSNCIFFGETQYIARIYGSSSTSFENCEFHQWNASLPAIYSNAGIVRVIGNNFYQAKSKQIYFAKGTEKGIVVGNSLNGDKQIQVDSGVLYAESANL